MTDTKKPRAPKTPTSYESIERGALRLHLEEKVNLRNKLNEAIKQEVEDAEQAAANAKKIAGNGTS